MDRVEHIQRMSGDVEIRNTDHPIATLLKPTGPLRIATHLLIVEMVASVEFNDEPGTQ